MCNRRSFRCKDVTIQGVSFDYCHFLNILSKFKWLPEGFKLKFNDDAMFFKFKL